MSSAAVLVSRFDAPALRKELGDVPKHVRVVTKPPRKAGKEAVLLATTEAMTKYHQQLRNMLVHDMSLVLFGNVERNELLNALQEIALLAADRPIAPYVVPDREALRRVVFAHAARAEDKLIASVSVEGDDIVVWSCEPKPYRVGVSAISALARMPADALANFRVSDSGSRVHWDEGDVDLSLDAFRVRADPAFRSKKERETRQEARRYATAIRALRVEKGLKQTEIAELSEREVRRLESGEHMPQYGSLEKLARAHRMSVDEYLGELARRASS
jgi:hypothetical protein